ncbi:MAG: ABC-type transport auxiliary lipoprotein family protein [Roseobacter sp.]|jgi:uncharacterized lipoprotein YmbA|nr:ABC-type transport auxiliary lipoprotein family protein [Roseobacter sp.]
MKKHFVLLAALTALAACSASSDRYAAVPLQVTETQRIPFRAVEVADVSLPAYAAADEISIQTTDGRLVSDGAVLWADTPGRAVALELSRYLTQLTGARVASSPWPFEALPDARLNLRFETLVAGEDGQFRARGQYFVAVPDARERSGLFDLAVPFDTAAGPVAIAQAREQVILDLAVLLVRNGLR